MSGKDRQVVTKILLEASLISGLIDGLDLDAFANDEKTKRAVCMTLINIGELVKILSEDFRLTYPDIPWRAIAGLRDVTAHRYQTLKMGDIWLTAKNDIPAMMNRLQEILEV